jgi:hypothetical protein
MEKRKSWATNCTWFFAAFRGTLQLLLCKWKEWVSNQARGGRNGDCFKRNQLVTPASRRGPHIVQVLQRLNSSRSASDNTPANSLHLSAACEPFFHPAPPNVWHEQKTVSKMLSSSDARDGASVAERDPSPSSSATRQAWWCSKSASL